jgi:hypothetical protein
MSKINQWLVLASAAMALTACGGGGGSAAATPPAAPASATVSTSVSPTIVTSPAGTTLLTITVANTGTTAVSGGTLTIPLPAGGKSWHAVGIASPCSSAGITMGSTYALTGLNVPAAASCVHTVTLTPSTVGSHVFTPSGLTNVTAGTTATLTIN